MVSLARRMNKLKALLEVRNGPGAAVLPSQVTRIHMEFAKRWNDGQYGPRKFWKTCLPRLKYWNPAIPMIVNRTPDTAGPAIMTIYLLQNQMATSDISSPVNPTTQPASSFLGSSNAPEPTSLETAVKIDMKGLRSDAILELLLEKTGAVPVLPTPQDEAEMREVRERMERAKTDRESMARHLAEKREEEAIMAKARSEAAALRDAL